MGSYDNVGTVEKDADVELLINWMLNTEYWNEFVNATYADQCHGGPTENECQYSLRDLTRKSL